ncbi:hypothetical protein ACNOYE_23765 [Nannocystaceae bacterium ST9]
MTRPRGRLYHAEHDATMVLPYYARLSNKQRAIYRRSDAVRKLAVPEAALALPLVAGLEQALAAGKTRATGRAAHGLLAELTRQLGVVALGRTRVLSVRPSNASGELHGLYERGRPVEVLGRTDTQITVWMRTAALARVVAFRTFLRTLLHELVHHLDYELLRLPDSLHTEGFFARESSLMRQLAPAPGEDEAVEAQLELPW